MSFRVVRSLRSAALAGAVVLAACGDSGSRTFGIVGDTDNASVRFANATASPLDLLQNGAVVSANTAPGTSIATCVAVDPTTPGLTARVTGTTTDLTGFPTSFAPSGHATVVAYIGPSSTIQFVSIPVTFTAAAGRSGLRVFNGSAALNSVDVYANAPGVALGTPIVSSLVFGATSTTVDLPAGSTQVRLTTAGTTNVVFDAGTFPLESAKSYTLVVSSATPAAVLVPDCQ